MNFQLLSCRACQHWSAPYDGINPSPQQYRSDTPGNDIEDEDELGQRVESDPIGYLAISPPPMALSPTLSSSDTISTSNQTGRASSALELEWDDIFADDNPSLSGALNAYHGGMITGVDTCMSTPTPPPLPPQHIQEMRRSATKLIRGSYIEESEFEDDVLVYDLVAEKDTKAAILERIMAASRQAHGDLSHRLSTMTTAKMVMQAVSGILSTRRRSEDGGKEEGKWSEDYRKQLRRRSDDCETEVWRRKEEMEDEIKRTDGQGKLMGHQFLTNGFNGNNDSIDEYDVSDEEGKSFKQNLNISDLTPTKNHTHTENQQHTYTCTQRPPPCLVTINLPSGHSESHDLDESSLPGIKNTTSDTFLTRYHELMHFLGVEPDCDDITDDIGTFRKRIWTVRQKLEEEEEAFSEEFVLSSTMNVLEEEGEEEKMDEEEEDGVERRSNNKEGNRRHGVPFTGLYFFKFNL